MTSPCSKGRLADVLMADRRRALAYVDDYAADDLLAESIDVLVAEVLGRCTREELSIDWANPSRTPVQEVHIQHVDLLGRRVTAPAQKIVVTIVFHGDPELLEYEASQRYVSNIDGDVRAGKIIFTFQDTELDAQRIEQSLAESRAQYDSMAGWANSDLRTHRDEMLRDVRAAVEGRRLRLLRDRALDAAIPIPIGVVDGAKQIPVPLTRRVVKVEARRATAAFVPEPILDDAHFEDILDVCTSWGRGMERTPGTASKFDEEGLRDQLLITLNSHWNGQAGAELFNGEGKTDILIREGGRNVFIAECKIWEGPSGVQKAVDQLLRYLVWRDTKAALIMFIRNQRVRSAIDKLHEEVAAHPAYLATRPGGEPTARVDYVLRADDEGRTIRMAVLPVAIPSSSS